MSTSMFTFMPSGVSCHTTNYTTLTTLLVQTVSCRTTLHFSVMLLSHSPFFCKTINCVRHLPCQDTSACSATSPYPCQTTLIFSVPFLCQANGIFPSPFFLSNHFKFLRFSSLSHHFYSALIPADLLPAGLLPSSYGRPSPVHCRRQATVISPSTKMQHHIHSNCTSRFTV